MEKLQFKVQEYEGPLDLLLQLIARHKMNIYDIEITALLEQYMLAIDQMRQQRLEIASEFLEMASQLVYIKTVMLLPRHAEGTEDPRRELTGALLEYQACKNAAAKLKEWSVGAERFVRPAQQIPVPMGYQRIHQAQEIARAYFLALGRGKRRLPPPVSAFSGIVARRVVPVSVRIAFVLKNLYQRASVSLDSLFCESTDRPEMVATFLAVLELVRDKRAALSADGKSLFMLRGKAMPPEKSENTE